MFFDVKHDIQITGRAAKCPSFAITIKSYARAMLNAGGNLDLHRFLFQNACLALAGGARIGDHATRSLAGRTGASDAKESLLIPDLAFPPT